MVVQVVQVVQLLQVLQVVQALLVVEVVLAGQNSEAMMVVLGPRTVAKVVDLEVLI